VIGGRQNDQDGALLAAIVRSPATTEDAFAVLPQDLRSCKYAPISECGTICQIPASRLPGRIGDNLCVRPAATLRIAQIVPDRLRNARRLLTLPDPSYAHFTSLSNDLARFAGLYWRRQHMRVKLVE